MYIPNRGNGICKSVFWASILLATFPFLAWGALDAPHDTTTGTGCLSCHQMTSTHPKLLPPLNHTPLPGDIDDTTGNGLCWSCHNEIIAPNVKTHSSLATSTKYGDWTVECWVCHSQHSQEQDNFNGSTYGKFIRSSVNLAHIKGGDGNTLGKTGIKSVVFKGRTGANSFADGEGTLDGICEVCHTMTSHFRNDGSGPDQFHANINSGQAGANCIPCHNHANGFVHGSGGGAGKACVECHTHSRAKIDKPACESCHYANVAVEHVLSRGFTCTVCHENFCGTGACPESASDAGVVNAMNTARSGSDILCSTCHDTPHFTASGSFITAHHETSYATAGSCTRCHVVGPGIDGPPKGPCTFCHGDSGRFPYRHANASTVDLAQVHDNRVCFSCHLEGGQGYKVGVTPLVTPMHAWSVDPLWPGDCWNSAAKDPVNGISGLPACSTMGVPGSYQAENYMQIVTTGQWSGPAGNTPEDQLLKRYPGFGTFHYNYDILGPTSSTYDRNNAEGQISVEGTIMDNNSSQNTTTKSSWAAGFLTNEVYSKYGRPSLDFVSVPITLTGSTVEVPSFDGLGGGGKPTATDSISATLTAVDTNGIVTVLPNGAAWRLDGGPWEESSAVLANQTVRPDHRIEYKPVAGWAAPWAGLVAVPGSAVAPYEQCPDDTSITITGPTSLTWDDPAAQEPYSVTGWLPADGAVHWELDTGGADGFTVTRVDATGAVIEKTGATTQGTYTFTLTAVGSTCFGNSATAAITVDVIATGAADPAPPTGEGIIGDAVIDSADIAGTPTDGRDLIQVAGTTFAFVSTRTNVGTIKTFTIAPDGHMAANPVLNSVTFPVTVNGYYQWARFIGITRVAGDLFAAVSGNTLQLVQISAAGQITLLSSSTWNKSDEQLRYILPLRNGVFVVASDRMLGAVTITEAGAVSWKQTFAFPAYNGSWFTENSRFFDLTPVAGDVYAIFYRTSASSNDILKVRTLRIDDSGNFTDLQTYSFPAVYRYGSLDSEGSMLRVGEGVFALAYADRQDADYIRTFAIAPDGTIAEPGLTNLLTFQHSFRRKPSLTKISGNVYATIARNGFGNRSMDMKLTTYVIDDKGIITPQQIDSLRFSVPNSGYSFKKLKLIPVAGDVYAFTEGNGSPVYTFTITADADGDGLFNSADCNDNDSSIGLAPDGTCDGDQDGLLDPAVGGTDCDDNNPAITAADDGTCDGDSDGLIDWTAGGTDCNDSSDTIGAAPDGTCDGDSDGFIDSAVTGGTDCNDNNAGIGVATDGTCDGDGDGAIDWTAGGTDCNDTDSSFATAADGTCDGDSDGLIDRTAGGTDCDDNSAAIAAAGDGTCDGDSDGLIDRTAGGTDCDDNNAAITAAADVTCDGDSDGLIELTAGGTDCDDNNAAITAAADGTCDGDSDGLIDRTAGGTDCDDNNAAITAVADGTCDGDSDGAIDWTAGGPDCLDNNGTFTTMAADGSCDGDGDGLYDTTAGGTDCNDNDANIRAATDGTCDGDADGLIDASAKADNTGMDCNDNDPSIATASDNSCDADGDTYIDLTAGGTDCNDGSSTIHNAPDGTCDGDGDGIIDTAAKPADDYGVDCDDNNTAIKNPADGNCDSDSDGFIDSTANGSDCNDLNASIIAATDGTCDGDGDTLYDLSAGGTDCDDAAAGIRAAPDSTCDGDADGIIDWNAGGPDCLDSDAAHGPAADSTCDGDNDTIIDGSAGGTDCDDTNSDIKTAADGTCDGDADSFIDPSAGGTDCDDNNNGIGYAPATCDADNDQYISLVYGGPDCLDTDPNILWAADTTCDGDGDTSIDWTAGGHDCNDNDAGILPPCGLTGNSTGYTSTTLTDSTANWKPNMFTGMSVTYHVTQTVCGYGCVNTEHYSTRTVISNTGNTLTVDSAWDFTTGFTPKEYTITLP